MCIKTNQKVRFSLKTKLGKQQFEGEVAAIQTFNEKCRNLKIRFRGCYIWLNEKEVEFI